MEWIQKFVNLCLEKDSTMERTQALEQDPGTQSEALRAAWPRLIPNAWFSLLNAAGFSPRARSMILQRMLIDLSSPTAALVSKAEKALPKKDDKKAGPKKDDAKAEPKKDDTESDPKAKNNDDI